MREVTTPTSVTQPRNHVCMAAFFIVTGVTVFTIAVLAALGIIDLLG